MLNVKPSRYNLIVDTQENGTILLFNTYSTALCLLNIEQQKFLKAAQYATDELPLRDLYYLLRKQLYAVHRAHWEIACVHKGKISLDKTHHKTHHGSCKDISGGCL